MLQAPSAEDRDPPHGNRRSRPGSLRGNSPEWLRPPAPCPHQHRDEATSSIDTRTERLIEKGLDALMKDRTVFVIAHRLSTVRNADAILVLEEGRIIERGDHADLLRQKGRYHQLYTGQYELS